MESQTINIYMNGVLNITEEIYIIHGIYQGDSLSSLLLYKLYFFTHNPVFHPYWKKLVTTKSFLFCFLFFYLFFYLFICLFVLVKNT